MNTQRLLMMRMAIIESDSLLPIHWDKVEDVLLKNK